MAAIYHNTPSTPNWCSFSQLHWTGTLTSEAQTCFDSCDLVQLATRRPMNTPISNSKSTEDTNAASRQIGVDSKLRDIVPFTAADRVFAVFASEVEGTAEAKIPAPLPHATKAVVGVVCVR